MDGIQRSVMEFRDVQLQGHAFQKRRRSLTEMDDVSQSTTARADIGQVMG